jgi:hypothetical protein
VRTTELAARQRPARDSGSVAAETVLVMPALMVLLLAGIQFALFGLATHAAALAVAEGGAAARSTAGGSAAGRQLVVDDVRALAEGLLLDPHVAVTTSPGGAVAVRLEATVPAVVPGLHLSVDDTSAGPAQEFRPG